VTNAEAARQLDLHRDRLNKRLRTSPSLAVTEPARGPGIAFEMPDDDTPPTGHRRPDPDSDLLPGAVVVSPTVDSALRADVRQIGDGVALLLAVTAGLSRHSDVVLVLLSMAIGTAAGSFFVSALGAAVLFLALQ
jgi:hypothetical protein